jgi:hypothetical protein
MRNRDCLGQISDCKLFKVDPAPRGCLQGDEKEVSSYK